MRNSFLSGLASLALGLTLSVTVAAQVSPNSPASQTPSATQSPQTGAQQNRSGGTAASIDDALQLTQAQKEKIASVVEDENSQIGTIRDDTTMSMEQKQQKAMQVRQAGSTKIRAILTPDQLQKLSAMQQQRERQQPDNNSPAPQAPQH